MLSDNGSSVTFKLLADLDENDRYQAVLGIEPEPVRRVAKNELADVSPAPAAASGQPERFHPPIRTGNALDQPWFPVGRQDLSRWRHRRTGARPDRPSRTAVQAAARCGPATESSRAGRQPQRSQPWHARPPKESLDCRYCHRHKLIVLGVGRVAGADMSVQPPGSAAPMIIGGRAGRGHCIGAAAHSHRAVDRGSPARRSCLATARRRRAGLRTNHYPHAGAGDCYGRDHHDSADHTRDHWTRVVHPGLARGPMRGR